MTATYPQPEGGCLVAENVIVCRPRFYAYRAVRECPTCERRRRFVVKWEMWYGNTEYCLGCGDKWEDGELGFRPFKPGWRKERIAYAKELYGKAMSRAEFRKASRAYMNDYYFADDEPEVETVDVADGAL